MKIENGGCVNVQKKEAGESLSDSPVRCNILLRIIPNWEL